MIHVCFKRINLLLLLLLLLSILINLSQLRDSCLRDFHLFYDQSERNVHTLNIILCFTKRRTNKSVSLRCSLSLFLLPPATKLGQGNIFRSVYQEYSVHWGGVRGRGACMAGEACMVEGMHGQGCVCGKGPCVAGRHAWWGGACVAGGMHGRGACVADTMRYGQ